MSAPLILGTNSIKDVGYNVDNSLRFDRGSSDSLQRTPSGAGNRRTFTFSCWVKKGTNSAGEAMELFDSPTYSSNTNRDGLRFETANHLRFFINNAASGDFATNRLFRDLSAWYHIVLSVDTTQATASNRVKIYVNGVQETSFSTETQPSQNYDFQFNTTGIHSIGFFQQDGGELFSGYMSEVVFIDGTQLDATSFGEFDEDSGIWKPIDVSGLTFGTNGFYLDFEDSSALGNDVSGNNNDFTVNNLTSIDQTTDTCTNNFATLNSLCRTNGSFLNGNLELDQNGGDGQTINSTFGVSNGKWYWEAKILNFSTNSRAEIGISDGINGITGTSGQFWNTVNGIGYNAFPSNDYITQNGTNGSSLGNSTTVSGDIFIFALDLDNNYFYIGRNGTWFNSGDPTSGATGTGSLGTVNSGVTYFASTTANDTTSNSIHNNDWQFNFGNPVHSITSGNSDGNGYGNFEYSVPSGYYALNTKNLAEYG